MLHAGNLNVYLLAAKIVVAGQLLIDYEQCILQMPHCRALFCNIFVSFNLGFLLLFLYDAI